MNDDTRHARRPVLCDCVGGAETAGIIREDGLADETRIGAQESSGGFLDECRRNSVLRRGPSRFAANEAGWAAILGVNFKPAVFAVDHVDFHPRLDVAD